MSTNKKKYLFVFDLDETLLTTNKRIPIATINFLRTLKFHGHKIILASGRPVRAMIKYYLALHLTTPLIGHNGGLVYHPLNKKFPTFLCTFKNEDIFGILKDIRCSGKGDYSNAIFETVKKVYMEKNKFYEDKYLHIKNSKIVFGDLENILPKEGPCSFLIDMKSNDYDKDEIKSIIKKYPHLFPRFWGAPFDTFIEINYDNQSKAEAIKYVLNQMPELKKYTLVCFGDSDNDFSMLDLAGEYGYLMKNSGLKSGTNYKITEDINNNNGVMKTIKKLLENN